MKESVRVHFPSSPSVDDVMDDAASMVAKVASSFQNGGEIRRHPEAVADREMALPNFPDLSSKILFVAPHWPLDHNSPEVEAEARRYWFGDKAEPFPDFRNCYSVLPGLDLGGCHTLLRIIAVPFPTRNCFDLQS
jgi:hypothetical protein